MNDGSAPGSARRGLSLDQIIETTLRLGVSDGFEALTMRRLGRELNASQMGMYYHVESKHALLRLVVDHVLRDVVVPGREEGDWEWRLRELSTRSRAATAPYPGLDQVMFHTAPTDEAWRLMDGYLQILLDAGFGARGAALGFHLFHAYAMGRASLLQRLRDSNSERPQPPDGPDALTQVREAWPTLHRADYQDFALDALLTGLRALLPEHRHRPK